MMRRAKKIDDEVDKKLAPFDSTKHWRDKMLSDMTKRDWRILREDFDIRIRRGKAPNPLRYWDESEISESILEVIVGDELQDTLTDSEAGDSDRNGIS